jgi:hypothetical protein
MPILVGKSPHIFDLLVEASAPQHDGSLHLQSCAVKPVLPATDRADAWGKAENVFIKSMGMTIYLSTCLPIYLSVCRCMHIPGPTTAWKSKAGSRNLEIWLLKVYIYVYYVIMYIYIYTDGVFLKWVYLKSFMAVFKAMVTWGTPHLNSSATLVIVASTNGHFRWRRGDSIVIYPRRGTYISG